MTYIITYHLHPADDIKIKIEAKNEEEAILFAKRYRKDAFSIKKEPEA